MNLDLGSFAFGSFLRNGTGTPSWGTALGQSKPDYKFTYPGVEPVLIGMVYCSVPLDTVSLPLGKGGRIYQASELKECQIASLFRKVYINGKRIDYPFVVLLVKESSDSHSGRKSIKYSDKNVYKSGIVQYSNLEFLRYARIALGIEEKACWFVYKFEVYNQDELHMSAIIVDSVNPVTYDNSSIRRNVWLDLISEKEIQFIRRIPQNTNHLDNIQMIYYGAPGTGKSHEIKEMTEGKRVVRTTFHPDSDYSTFVGAYKPVTVEVPMRDVTGKVIMENGKPVTENRIVYEFVEQAFLQAYIKAWKQYVEAMDEGKETEEVYLVIEEINRGNCAQIFGDLFQLLDRGDNGFSEYPIVADKDLQKLLKRTFENIKFEGVPAVCGMSAEEVAQRIGNGEILLLPNNLYIWATMNTSDQSLFPIDSAFKRRWDWHYMPIANGEKGWQIGANGKRYDWWEFLQKVNEQIGTVTNSEDKKLGYYFCKAKNGVIDSETFVGKVIFYLWNDVFKDIIDEIGTMFNDADGNRLSFNRFYTVVDGKTEVVEDTIERFLLNLGVESVKNIETEDIVEDEDGNVTSSTTRDYSKFSINGEGKWGKNRLATECVKKYIEMNPNMPIEEVLRNWRSIGNIVPNFIESKEEYDARKDNSKRSYGIPCGESVIYVAHNGYGSNGKVFTLIDAVNKKDWGIELAKVEE